MKKAATAKATTTETSSRCTLKKVENGEHLHASNCGHKSYVHNDHICYQQGSTFHYMHDGHTHECTGPTPAAVIPLNRKK